MKDDTLKAKDEEHHDPIGHRQQRKSDAAAQGQPIDPKRLRLCSSSLFIVEH